MSQKSVLLALTIAIVLMVNVGWTEAKRVGCASFGHSCYGGHGKRSDLNSSPQQEINDSSESQQQTILRILQRKFPPPMDIAAASTNEFQVLNENEKELKLTILNVLRDSIDETYRRIREFESKLPTV